MAIRIERIEPGNGAMLERLNWLFGQVFDDHESYAAHPPSREYLERLLSAEYFIALAALDGDEVVGGLTAYELRKFEQERSEVYLYDLAVRETYWRRGIATRLIEELKEVAASRGAYVIFVQADKGEEDQPAIALYSKLGRMEDVFHFDIEVQEKAR